MPQGEGSRHRGEGWGKSDAADGDDGGDEADAGGRPAYDLHGFAAGVDEFVVRRDVDDVVLLEVVVG